MAVLIKAKMETILNNWNFMRSLRLVMGLWVIYSSITDNQPLLGVLGALFVYQAIMNLGCCGSGGCNISVKENNANSSIENVDFEEIKP
jgi:hypothetical protein